MAISKVVYDGNTIIDLTGDTVTADKLLSGVTAHGKDGAAITGTCGYDADTSDADAAADTIQKGKTAYVNGEKVTGTLPKYSGWYRWVDGTASFEPDIASVLLESVSQNKVIIEQGCKTRVRCDAQQMGDATAADVAKGKTFTSVSGLAVTGTMEPGGTDTSDATATAADMAEGKTAYVNGEKITGTVQVLESGVSAYWTNTVWSGLSENLQVVFTRPKDSLERAGSKLIFQEPLSHFGDATAADVAKGKTFTSTAGLKVAGTMEAAASDNNCEAYHLTSATQKIAPKGTGPVKVWGYGLYTQSTYYKQVYAFVGDGYYKPAQTMGNPTKTSVSFSVNVDGTLNGLPSSLDNVDLLVTIGI